YQESTDFTFL
nr:Chain C, Serine/threonine-protein kinase unc-51 [Caenorhabditis elegans]5AZG_D Chain D, Serine/threonine-protein kinase unc-51 [Caenorhabditis elegans]